MDISRLNLNRVESYLATIQGFLAELGEFSQMSREEFLADKRNPAATRIQESALPPAKLIPGFLCSSSSEPKHSKFVHQSWSHSYQAAAPGLMHLDRDGGS